MADSAFAEDLEEVYRSHRRRLFALCYRMTGSASDAEDLVQDTFARALHTPPKDTSRDWRPWLMRVAVNLSRDHLRRRKRARYVGPWLPEPIVTDGDDGEPAQLPETHEGRYELLESCSYAFLVALEALTPSQRAVLLLRDVFEYTGVETAGALGLSEANVRQLLHRARTALTRYDSVRPPITQVLRDRTLEVLVQFLRHVEQQDVAAVERLLADDVVVTNDGAGRYFAARTPIAGRNKVARSSVKLYSRYSGSPEIRVLELNGLPAIVGRYPRAKPGHAREFAHLIALDRAGHLHAGFTLLAPLKLQPLLRATFPQNS